MCVDVEFRKNIVAIPVSIYVTRLCCGCLLLYLLQELEFHNLYGFCTYASAAEEQHLAGSCKGDRTGWSKNAFSCSLVRGQVRSGGHLNHKFTNLFYFFHAFDCIFLSCVHRCRPSTGPLFWVIEKS